LIPSCRKKLLTRSLPSWLSWHTLPRNTSHLVSASTTSLSFAPSSLSVPMSLSRTLLGGRRTFVVTPSTLCSTKYNHLWQPTWEKNTLLSHYKRTTYCQTIQTHATKTKCRHHNQSNEWITWMTNKETDKTRDTIKQQKKSLPQMSTTKRWQIKEKGDGKR